MKEEKVFRIEKTVRDEHRIDVPAGKIGIFEGKTYEVTRYNLLFNYKALLQKLKRIFIKS